jgi:AraC family transcriptional regulator, positive regulator of tynA and feaB
MQTLFTTAGLPPRRGFSIWKEAFRAQIVPAEHQRVGDLPFRAKLEAARFGSLVVVRDSHTGLRSEGPPDMVRRYGLSDTVNVILKLAGRSIIRQEDREAAYGKGDLIVIAPRPAVNMAGPGGDLVLSLPRERLESVLGPVQLYMARTVSGTLGTAALAKAFFQALIRVGPQLAPDSAERMAQIGVDLIVASFAERMAQDLPRGLHGSVVVQRAKAYVEANLSDPDLDPPRLAAAVGVSLRRLQELFHARGRHISDYIWERRLETAARRLADPACAHLPIGQVAYGCGFTSQAHFARRFRDRYGLTPREHRQTCVGQAFPGTGAARQPGTGDHVRRSAADPRLSPGWTANAVPAQ